ncbi:hypothetical protein MHYP_G00033410 [Metynnis hypsauchen]
MGSKDLAQPAVKVPLTARAVSSPSCPVCSLEPRVLRARENETHLQHHQPSTRRKSARAVLPRLRARLTLRPCSRAHCFSSSPSPQIIPSSLAGRSSARPIRAAREPDLSDSSSQSS